MKKSYSSGYKITQKTAKQPQSASNIFSITYKPNNYGRNFQQLESV